MADAPRLAVSNIAWEPSEDDAVAAVLRREGVTGVEIAPTKWRERPFDASVPDVAAYRREWEDRGLRVVALQALLFGRPDLQLFKNSQSRADLSDYLRRVIDFAGAVGAHALVFGSPKNRVRGELPMSDAMRVAAEFLRTLGDHCTERGVSLCVEANPADYGCDFVTTTDEAAALCRAVGHPAIRVNIDLGGITMVGDAPSSAVRAAGDLIGHVHASEPNLAEIGAASDHADAARTLAELGYREWVSIEMRAAGDHVATVRRAIAKTKAAYSESAEFS